MNENDIASNISTKWAGRTLSYSDIIDSTNNVADEAGKKGMPSGFLAVADRQDAGRGSRGRSWISPAGNNVFMSIMVRPEIPMDKVSGLTLVMALSVSKAIEALATDGNRCGIKWPNDVVLNERKVCGILTELHQGPGQGDYYVVIGVGINVNQPSELFSEQIRQTAGSIYSETGRVTDRSRLIAEVMKYFEEDYEAYCTTCDLSLLKEEYEKRLLNVGKQVRILDPKGEYEALAKGIDNTGALIITRDDKTEELINAGEVSVRGLYGYV